MSSNWGSNVEGSRSLPQQKRNNAGPDTRWNRVWFGVGQSAEGIKTSVMGSVLLFYYSQVLGLDPKLAGLALLLATLTDGISDVLVGGWTDTLRHRWGRRHPLMYAAILPFGLSFMALFLPPNSLGQTGLFFWLLFASLLARNAMTLFVIPHYALGAELSNDHDGRTVVTAYRQFFGFIGTGMVFLTGMMFFLPTDAYPVGQLNPERYAPYGITLGCIILITIFTSTLFTHNVIPFLPEPEPGARFSVKQAMGDIWSVSKLPSFAYLLSAFLIWLIGLYVFRLGEIYLATYFWRLDQQLVFLLPLMNAVAALLVTPFWVIASRRWGKKWSILVSLVVGVSAYCLFVLVKVFGYLSPDFALYEVLVFAISFVIAMVLAAPLVITGSMVADVADEYELKSGLRREGVLFGAINFVSKLCTGLGAQLMGLIIAMAGLVPKSDPADVSMDVSNSLGLGVALSFFVVTAIAMLLFAAYPLSRERVEGIQMKLALRNNVENSDESKR